MSTDDQFAVFHMTGERFDAVGMPAETAVEVGNYREVIYSVARQLWVDSHPGRLRVPNGFRDAFDLRLTEIRTGSARPRLLLNKPGSVSDNDFSEWEVFYYRARDYVTEAVRTVDSRSELPYKFPRSSVKPLRRLGRTLRASETITVGPPKWAGPKATLDERFRTTIAKIDDVLPQVPTERIVEGMVTQYDSASGGTPSFRLRSLEGDVINCTLGSNDRSLARVVRDSLSLDGLNAPDVRVEGQALLDEEGLFKILAGVHAVKQVRSLTEKQLMGRLSRLRLLADGWSGGRGRALSVDALAKVERVVSVLATLGISVSIGPSTSGAIVLEWRRGASECSAEIQDDGRMYLVADNVETDGLLEIDTPYDEALLVRFLRQGDWSD